ncbi:EamA family transporter [Rhodococcus sp. F64268]|uniref:EamA family transporter n=1 Tax=Rhodococcus sp. F64268 TaxID=2926402 RepID=UPI001FF1953C|nr:EamA family transporter [Rhodococcus sp. F64268]MCK0089240.1 EamA family transporter [Rhodococcus sp. F64268]
MLTRATRAREVVLVLAAITSIQFGAAFAAGLFDRLGPGGTTALRLTIAGLILVVVVRPRVWAWSGGTWLGSAALGLCMAGMNVFFYESIARIPLGVAVSIEFTGPLLVALMNSRRLTELFPVAIAAVGIGIFGVQAYGETAALDPFGVTMALIAAVFWALYILAASRAASQQTGLDVLAGATVMAGALTIWLAIPVATEILSPSMLAAGLALALLASVIPVTCEMTALKTLPKRSFSVLVALEPGAGVLAGYLVLGQSLSGLQGLAVSLIVTAAVLVTVLRQDQRPTLPC